MFAKDGYIQCSDLNTQDYLQFTAHKYFRIEVFTVLDVATEIKFLAAKYEETYQLKGYSSPYY